jgi:Protein of unknown function (DUF3052).
VGREHTCEGSFNGERGEGKALLETDEVIFRGAFRARVKFNAVTSITVRAGALSLKTGDGTLTLYLGEYAEPWAEKIRNPPSRIEKLGVKPAMSVSVLGIDDDAFLKELRERTERITAGRAVAQSDIIFASIARESDLRRLERLKASLKPDGAIWTIRPKGKNGVSEAAVRAAGLAAGLVDVKVARFSDTHTAEKFVIPKAKRR